ncbi:hypothetical protein ASG49_04275 [Marmoricola sp. Leaf446]|uniref:hypothetical protein n=1 Tax=Marmoricola sp. Leaf446 TaxID=1736379 RepID=UPI0006FBE56C|nr:hypothetical protein [Marmoricola sp. Leaf446]KQT94134.1 hypothetical protein ASG49_04275 [Marmoricola sp. Leaf446]
MTSPHQHRADRAGRRLPRGRLALLALGLTGCVVAWGLLVELAVGAGRQLGTGDGAWAVLVVATVAAAACLLLGLLLGVRLAALLRDDPRPPRTPGRRVSGR